MENCVSELKNQFYNYSSNLICECSENYKCKISTQKSLELDLCEVCNNDLGYYEKVGEEQRSDNLVK